MLITTSILSNTDSQIVVLVKQTIYQNGQEIPVASMVTIDKILGDTIVHRAGETRRTKSLLVALNPDEVDYEEAAVVATLYFPEE